MGGLPTDEAAAYIDSLARRAAECGWRPIDTAPPDLTVDVWGTTPLSGTTYELWGRTHTRPAGQRRADVMWCSTHKCWRVAADLHFVNTLGDFTPTHWRPLPPPPPRLRAVESGGCAPPVYVEDGE